MQERHYKLTPLMQETLKKFKEVCEQKKKQLQQKAREKRNGQL